MKNLYVSTFVGLILATMTSCGNNGNSSVAQSTETAGKDALEVIMTRTSVRQYTDQAITSETIDTLLRAGMAAPTAGNKQPWKFVVVTDRASLDSLAAGNWRMAAEAQAAIIVCGDTENVFPGEGRDYWVQDCSAASENILLAAHAVGLGAVWCGCYPISERVEKVRNLFEIPSSIVPMSVLLFGYPAGEQTPKDKYKPENVHFNKW